MENKPPTPNHSPTGIKKQVQIWLLTGVVLVLVQVVIGGVTRLTDSGLSITEWAVIQGTLPPANEAEWQKAFDLYKAAARKQYETLHADMTLREFKFIYFWEYFHRLWARMMGFVFLFPFLYFYFIKKWIPKWLLRRLGVVILLASLAAVFGWIMVVSGLNNDTRTWVSAYKLSVHLGIATVLLGYLFWTWLLASQPRPDFHSPPNWRKWGRVIVAVLGLQIILGGLMAGMRAALIHPHFPFFVEGQRLWNALAAPQGTGLSELADYESGSFIKAIVQLLHRITAWLLAILIIYFYWMIKKGEAPIRLRKGNQLLITMLIIQFSLGALTIINSVGKIPLFPGAAHQAGALVLLICVLYVNFQFKKS
ncbi:MAG TPA: heme A synthase [Bacteroidetes bacterium]|nr:heme A synthase [Bacteroidota bacterium]